MEGTRSSNQYSMLNELYTVLTRKLKPRVSIDDAWGDVQAYLSGSRSRLIANYFWKHALSNFATASAGGTR